MNTLQIIGGALLLITSVVIIISVTLQEGKTGGMGALTGESSGDTFMDKNKNRTKEAALARVTKYAGIALFALSLGILAINVYM